MNIILALLVDRMSFLKPAEKRRLFSAVESVDSLGRLTLDQVARTVGRPLSPRRWYFPMELRAAQQATRWLLQNRVAVLRLDDVRYPRALAEIYDPPFLLYLRGNPKALTDTPVAVVGTRRPDGSAAQAAYEFGARAAEEGICLVSGLARGIDSMVHRGAVSRGGSGVAVLGSGIDTIYPRENRRLAMALLENGGACVSEYAPGVPPLKYHFPARNRIISGLVRAVVLLQAPARSGALITVDHALEQGREVFVHRAGLGIGAEDPRSAGGRELAESGAPLIGSLADAADLLGIGLAGSTAAGEGTGQAGASRSPWGNSLADRMARQLSLGQEEGIW